MATIKARGLVLKTTDVGESDRIVTLLLFERGRLSVSAKGARNAKSKFLAGAQPFNYCDFVLFAGTGFYSLASAELVESYYGVTKDYDTLCAGSYMLELTEKVIMENANCDDMLGALLISLRALVKGAHPPELVRSVYEYKFLQLNGYSPVLDVCSACGGELSGRLYFGPYGAVCSACADEDTAEVSAGCLHAISYIVSSDIKRLFLFTADKKITAELIRAGGIFFNAHMDVDLSSRKFVP